MLRGDGAPLSPAPAAGSVGDVAIPAHAALARYGFIEPDDELEGTVGAAAQPVALAQLRVAVDELGRAQLAIANVRAVIAWAQTPAQDTQYPAWSANPRAVAQVANLRFAHALACDAATRAAGAAMLWSHENAWCTGALEHAKAADSIAEAVCNGIAHCWVDPVQPPTPYGTQIGYSGSGGEAGRTFVMLDARFVSCVEQLVGQAGDAIAHAYQAFRACVELATGTLKMASLGATASHPVPAPRAISAPSTVGDAATDQALAQIEEQLGPAVTPAQLESLISHYTGLTTAQQGAILNTASTLLAGGSPSYSSLTPLIAGALAIAGAAAPVVAVIGAGLALLPNVLAALGITQGSQDCTFKVGAVCFKQKIPYGPTDPTTGQPNPDWTTWNAWLRQQEKLGYQLLDAAFPLYRATLGCDLEAVNAALYPSFSHPYIEGTTEILLFLRGFIALYHANAERAINGHPFASDGDLFARYVSAWNETHGADRTYTFQAAKQSVDMQVAQWRADHKCWWDRGNNPPPIVDPAAPTWVSYLISGDVDGAQRPPIVVNVGKSTIAPPVLPAPPKPSSGAAAVVAVAGAAAIAGASVLALSPAARAATAAALHIPTGRRR